MGDAKEQMTNPVERLTQQRDELQLKLHLANADAKDEWARQVGRDKAQTGRRA